MLLHLPQCNPDSTQGNLDALSKLRLQISPLNLIQVFTVFSLNGGVLWDFHLLFLVYHSDQNKVKMSCRSTSFSSSLTEVSAKELILSLYYSMRECDYLKVFDRQRRYFASKEEYPIFLKSLIKSSQSCQILRHR